MTTKHTSTLLAAAALAGLSLTAFAGSPPSAEPKKAIETPHLSILDGRVVFEVQERIRWEVRDNNFDFNSKVNTVNDDNWFEQRLRIGMLVKVAPWLRIYAQAQDSREWLLASLVDLNTYRAIPLFYEMEILCAGR